MLLNTMFGQKLVLLKTEEKLRASGNANCIARCLSSSSSLVPSAPQLRKERLSGANFTDVFSAEVKCSTLSPHVYNSNAGSL